MDLDLIDSHSGEVEAADFVFVFGTRQWTPAEVAADCYVRGLAPFVVVTGGSARQFDGVGEARLHEKLLLAAGVPGDAIVVEEESVNTPENVEFAVPAITARCPDPKSAIAVVKWYHRRAVVELARAMPSLERIYAADYEPHKPVRGLIYARNNWSETCGRSIERETQYMRQLASEGIDLLVRSPKGWLRSKAP